MMFDQSQLMRGTLEGCILQVISNETSYGYEIMEKLKSFGFTEISEGTIYPLLVRLERKELISSELRASPLGPNRKYYTLSHLGEEMLVSFIESWGNISRTVEKIIQTKDQTNEC